MAERRERHRARRGRRHARGRERARPPDLATHAGGAHARAPRYGTVGPEQIPVETVDRNGSFVRVIAGRYRLTRGPARFAVNVQILDIELKPDTEYLYERPPNMDNVMFYGLDGGGRLNGANTLYQRQICRFDTTTGKVKVSVSASSRGMRFMVFAGVALKEP